MCSFKFLTFKFDFDIIKIEHKVSLFHCLSCQLQFWSFLCSFSIFIFDYPTFFRDEGIFCGHFLRSPHISVLLLYNQLYSCLTVANTLINSFFFFCLFLFFKEINKFISFRICISSIYNIINFRMVKHKIRFIPHKSFRI